MSSIYYKVLEVLEETELTNDLTSAPLQCFSYNNIGLQVIWDSLTGTIDATIDVEVSIDGLHWDKAMSTINITGTSDNDCLNISSLFYPFLRVKITQNGVTGGTVKVLACLKE